MKDPIALFQTWLQEAVDVGLKEPSAMTVATVNPDGHPDARMVLLKGVDARGFVFSQTWKARRHRLCDMIHARRRSPQRSRTLAGQFV